ncbi:MAG: hypothetical protein ACJ74Q_10560 [Pyrinomonadaceae bacterium]
MDSVSPQTGQMMSRGGTVRVVVTPVMTGADISYAAHRDLAARNGLDPSDADTYARDVVGLQARGGFFQHGDEFVNKARSGGMADVDIADPTAITMLNKRLAERHGEKVLGASVGEGPEVSPMARNVEAAFQSEKAKTFGYNGTPSGVAGVERAAMGVAALGGKAAEKAYSLLDAITLGQWNFAGHAADARQAAQYWYDSIADLDAAHPTQLMDKLVGEAVTLPVPVAKAKLAGALLEEAAAKFGARATPEAVAAMLGIFDTDPKASPEEAVRNVVEMGLLGKSMEYTRGLGLGGHVAAQGALGAAQGAVNEGTAEGAIKGAVNQAGFALADPAHVESPAAEGTLRNPLSFADDRTNLEALEGRLVAVKEASRKLRAGLPLTPDEVRLHYQASQAQLSAEPDVVLRRYGYDVKPIEDAAGVALWRVQTPGGRAPVELEDAELLELARRARADGATRDASFIPEVVGGLADVAPSRGSVIEVSKLGAELKADGDPRAEVLFNFAHSLRRLEGRRQAFTHDELASLWERAGGDAADIGEPPQPRPRADKFVTPRIDPTEWPVRSQAVIDGRNPDEAVAEARADGRLPPAAPLPPPAAEPSLFHRVVRTTLDAAQLPKMKAGFDFSATGGQAVPQLLAHPSYFPEMLRAQFKAFASEDAARSLARDITSRPDFPLMRESNLFLSSAGSGPEEAFRAARLADKIASTVEKVPVARYGARAYKASERAYSAAMDTVRVAAWDTYVPRVIDGPHTNEKTFRAIAELVNMSTGRGKVPILDRYEWGRKFVDNLNVAFFSPRNMAAKANLVSPTFFFKNVIDPATRPVAFMHLREASRGLGVLAATAGLVKLAHDELGVPATATLDPRSSDFGRLRIGKATYDLTGGEAYTVKYLAQMAQSAYKSVRGKQVLDRSTLSALTLRYLRSQLQPLTSAGVDLWKGKSVDGKPVTSASAALNLITPFVVDDVVKGFQAEGWLGALKGTPGAFMRVNFYDKPKEKGKRGGGSASPAVETDANYMQLEGEPVSRNVEDRRETEGDSAPYTSEDHRVLVEERTEQGAPEIDEAQAGAIALTLDSVPERDFGKYAKSLDEAFQLGRVGEAATYAGEYGSKALASSGLVDNPDAYKGAAESHKFLRMLAREKRLRPVQFYFDAAAGRYGERMRVEATEGIYYPQNHLPRR